MRMPYLSCLSQSVRTLVYSFSLRPQPAAPAGQPEHSLNKYPYTYIGIPHVLHYLCAQLWQHNMHFYWESSTA